MRQICILLAVLLGGPVLAVDAPRLETWFADPAMDHAALSPSGSHIAAITTEGGVRRLVVFDEDLRSRTVHAFSREQVLSVHWATAERLLLSVAAPGQVPGLFAINRDGSQAMRLIPARAGPGLGVQIADLLPTLASEILVSDDSAEDFVPELFRLDIFSAQRKREQVNDGQTLRWLVDASGVARAAVRWQPSPGQVRYELHWRRDDTREFLPVHAHGLGEARFEPLGLAAAGRILVEHAPADGETGLYLFDPRTRRFGDPLLSIGHAEISGLRWSGANPAPALVEYDTSEPVRRVLDARWRVWLGKLDAQLGNTRNRLLGVSADEKLALVLAASDRDPGSYWIYRIESDRLRRVGSRMPWWRSHQAARVEPVAFPARDGLSLEGYLTRPSGKASPSPLVLMIHGGPWARDRLAFDPTVQWLASRGYAVLQVNFRGSRGYGQSFLMAGQRQWGKAMQHDLDDALAWALAQGITRRETIATLGASYGGYASLLAAFRGEIRPAASIAFAPVTDLEAQIAHFEQIGNRRAAAEWRSMVGDEGPALREVSPVTYANAGSVPILLVHGRRDLAVPAGQSERFVREAAARKDLRSVFVDDAGHGLDHMPTRMAFHRELETFLDRYLPIGPDSAPDQGKL